MAWKLKKSKASADEVADAPDLETSPEASATSQFDRAPGSGHDLDQGSDDRTVMLLSDTDFIPGLIPGSESTYHQPAESHIEPDLFPEPSDEDLSRYLRNAESFDASSLGSDDLSHGIDIDADTQEAPIDIDDSPSRPSINLDDFDSGIQPIPVLHDDYSQSEAPIDLDVVAPEPIVAEKPVKTRNGSSRVAKPEPAPIDFISPTLEPEIEAAQEPETDYISSALSASDDAVASFREAVQDPPPAPIIPEPVMSAPEQSLPTAGQAMENWDLDAFAPYQPPGAGSVARPAVESSSFVSAGAPIEESLTGAVTASRLIVRLGQFSASYEIVKPETTIGRPDPRTRTFPDVAVEWDDAVSRNHCRILHRDDGDYVEDTGSTNGSRLNDKPLAPYKALLLTDGDRIGVGEKTEITYIR